MTSPTDRWADGTAGRPAPGSARVHTSPVPTRHTSILLENIERVEPHHVDPLLPALPVHDLHPIFHGCFDWHSAVHSHWSLARIGRADVLHERITPAAVAGEVATLEEGRAFEVPYGLAWLLTLDAEVGQGLRAVLAPLTSLARDRLLRWTARPVDESGLHRQTAFSAWLTLRWARIVGDDALATAIHRLAHRAWGDPAPRTLIGEAGPTDFLSPSLCAAALMVEVVDDPGGWLTRFLPSLTEDLRRVDPAVNPDPTDGHGTHLDGLNLSRAWAGRRISPHAHTREFVRRHADAGLAASGTRHFAGSHWLPTFAVMLLTDLSMPPEGYARHT